MQAQVCVERAYELGVLFAVGKWAEDPIRELADVALGPPQHERVRAEIFEHRDGTITRECAADDDGLLRLQESEVRSGGAALRTTDAGREALVSGRTREASAEGLRVGAGVDRGRELAQHRDDPGARPHDACLGDELGDRHAETSCDRGIARREGDREVLDRSVHRALLPD